MLCPVVLCGGAGTRLWPWSVADKPKPFLPLVTEQTLFQDTLTRLSGLLTGAAAPLVVCNRNTGALIVEQAAAVDLALRDVILEPVGRNTAPAVAVAAHAIVAQEGEDAIILVVPADHVILDQAAFSDAVEVAYSAAAEGALVTFGVVPEGPETGFGYILKGTDAGLGCVKVESFAEKPDPETAESYFLSGRYLWNSGMFMFRASAYLRELRCFAPDISEACETAWSSATKNSEGILLDAQVFGACRSDSIDYAVMERTDSAVVVPLVAGWSDVGSWASLFDVLPKDDNGNVLRGESVSLDSKGCYVHSNHRRVAVLGVEDLVVVETADAVLVVHRDRSQDVKQLIESTTS